MAQDRRQSERMLHDARLQTKEALAKHEKAPIPEGHGQGHAVHNFTARDHAQVEVGDHVHYTINNYAEEQSKKVSKQEIREWMKCTDFTKLYKKRHLPILFGDVGKKPLQSDEFKNWYDGTKKWLWCHGMPGAGKSALATIIIRHITELRKGLASEKNIGLAYVYCDYAAKDQSALDYVGALLHQLVNLSDQVSPEIAALYEDHKPGSSPTDDLLDGYEKVLETEVRRFDSVYIIVDALDECRDDDQAELQPCTKARLLQTLGNLGDTIHVLITSRDEHPPASLLDPITQVVTLKVSTTDNDIRTYIRRRVDIIMPIKDSSDVKLRDDIERTVTERAAKMFLPAKLYMEILAGTIDACQPKKTNVDALKNTLKSLPQFDHTRISESYQKAYQVILKNIWSQSLSRVTLARRVLSWVIFTREPSNLTIAVLQRALSLEDEVKTAEHSLEPTHGMGHGFDDGSHQDSDEVSESATDDGHPSTSIGETFIKEETLLLVCRGLVTLDQDSKHIRFVHYTAQTYFTSKAVRENSFPNAESQLTRSCMASLMRGEAEAFFEYSCKHWGYHAQTVESQFQENILDVLQNQERMESLFQPVVESLSHVWTASSELELGRLQPLHVMAYFGLESTATDWREETKSTNLESKDRRGWTAMKWAVIGDSSNLVRLLFHWDNALLTPEIAFSAVGHRDYEVNIDSMAIPRGRLSYGAALILKSRISFAKALPRAIKPNASDEVVKFLLKNIPVETINTKRPTDERTLLSVVAQNWQWDYVEILLENGANVNLKDSKGRTPLLWALSCPRRKIRIKLMRVSGDSCLNIGDISRLDSSTNVSIADHGISEKTIEPIICRLIGNDLEAANEDRRTALSLACESRFHVVTEELVNKGADLNTKDILGMTPLHYACCLPCFETIMVEKMVCLEFSKTRLGTNRLRQLELKKKKKKTELKPIGRSVALLLKAGATVDAKNYLGETPLSLSQGDGLWCYARYLDPHGTRFDTRTELEKMEIWLNSPPSFMLPSSREIEVALVQEGDEERDEDYVKLLLAMLDRRSRFQVQELEAIDSATLIIYSSSAIETLSTKDQASVIIEGRPSIECLTTHDESTIEIRAASTIEHLHTDDASQAVINGSSNFKHISASGMSILSVNAKAKIKEMCLSKRCAVYFSGSTQVDNITGRDASSLTIKAEARVGRIDIKDFCTVFSKGNSQVIEIIGSGASRLALMGSASIGHASVTDKCTVLYSGMARAEHIICRGQSSVSMEGEVDIYQIDTRDKAGVQAMGRTRVMKATGRGSSRLLFRAEVSIHDIDALDDCVVAIRGRTEVSGIQGRGRSRLIFDGEIKIVKMEAFNSCQVNVAGISKGSIDCYDSAMFWQAGRLTRKFGSLRFLQSVTVREHRGRDNDEGVDSAPAMDTEQWKSLNDQVDKWFEVDKARRNSAENKLSEDEERWKKAEDHQNRGEEWSWEPTGEEPDVEYKTWPSGRFLYC